MDRRRFVPSKEGLEGRALLATGLFGGSVSTHIDPAQEVPVTYALKEHRVERLPHFLELIKSGRYLPADTIKQLQADLLAVAANLHAPDTNTLLGFNTRLRQVDPSSSLSVANAAGLSHSFGVAVTSTGATTQQVNNLLNDMNALAKVDAASPQPVFLASNDYTLVLETVLSIGRPIRRPTSAQLAAHNGKRQGPNFGITPKSQPTVVGNYDAFATVQIVDKAGNVYGTSNVKKDGPTQSNGVANDTGKYAITFNQPLADGLYTFFVRMTDSEGHMSHISPPFKLKVFTRRIDAAETLSGVPGGPHGLK